MLWHQLLSKCWHFYTLKNEPVQQIRPKKKVECLPAVSQFWSSLTPRGQEGLWPWSCREGDTDSAFELASLVTSEPPSAPPALTPGKRLATGRPSRPHTSALHSQAASPLLPRPSLFPLPLSHSRVTLRRRAAQSAAHGLPELGPPPLPSRSQVRCPRPSRLAPAFPRPNPPKAISQHPEPAPRRTPGPRQGWARRVAQSRNSTFKDIICFVCVCVRAGGGGRGSGRIELMPRVQPPHFCLPPPPLTLLP